MNNKDKLILFKKLNQNNDINEIAFYDVLEKTDSMFNYIKYMTTKPIDCDAELLRVTDADYELCCALLLMLLREDHFNNGSFERRLRAGQVKPVVDRIIMLLSAEEA